MPANTKKKAKTPDLRQSNFFDLLANTINNAIGSAPVTLPAAPDLAPIAGRYGDDQRARRWINDLIRAAGVSREIIAERMSQLSGAPVSKAMIDSWTGAGRPNNFPLCHFRAFLRACDAGPAAEHEFLAALLDGTGWSPIDAARARLIALGQYAGAMLEAAHNAWALMSAMRGRS